MAPKLSTLVLLALTSVCSCAPPSEPDPIVTSISGRIFDTRSSAPLSGTLIRTEPPSQQVVSDENGTYRIVIQYSVPEMTVLAERSGYLPSRNTVRVQEGYNVLLDVGLTRNDDSSCGDGVQGLGETDVDCGGPCRPCAIGRRCTSATDCDTGLCLNGVCESACPDPRRTGPMCDECLPRFQGPDCQACSSRRHIAPDCVDCANGWSGPDCDRCEGRWTGADCDMCASGWIGPDCQTCPENYTGPDCDQCANRWTGDGCDICPMQFAGPACDRCADRFTGPECETCIDGWSGDDCQTCPSNYTGSRCDRCAEGFSGPDCSVCADDRFTGPECDECRCENVSGPDCDECAPGWGGFYNYGDCDCPEIDCLALGGDEPWGITCGCLNFIEPDPAFCDNRCVTHCPINVGPGWSQLGCCENGDGCFPVQARSPVCR